ncbi:MAG: rhomboid family intramembrane serine protease [Theionarchaea archaeon]|nr:rhomboid family intramembrane serine protease [Theionarchaea archaeon]MBU7001307.1 rhomboid family intramembrane serine protease [Theionarchaea archaeon]MBU7019798.1 rhomboid family intramembrane serine protease [Theionarchaea archaeon]MBU7035572.1 rhomboid family intramembrane serine protease [Theionarchaea archaeon]MBU7041216.1 rhomboid family intramembrane serine protease [Theionarchaea archaeon]
MLPIRDFRPTRIFPTIMYGIIVVNIAVFVLELYLDSVGYLEWFYENFAVIPYLIVRGENLYTLLTSMFMHGGVAHILFNMLYLHIFGNNVEDSMGHIRFIVFYVVCGLIASFAQIFIDPSSQIPNLGASGAIAGVLGAYLVMYPRERIDALLGYMYVKVPAVLVLLSWFVLQLFSGFLSLGDVSSGGVAFFAHIGGFVAGAILVFVFRKRRREQW